VALVVLFWLGGMTCVETARRAASRQKQLQMEPRGLLALGIFRQLQFNFTSSEVQRAAGDTGIDKWPLSVHYLHCLLNIVSFRRILWAIHVARISY